MAKKILLLGKAGTGKSSIKKVIFEGKDPKDLLYNPIDPTRGITPSVYSWLGLELGIFDTSGQELDFLLENKKERTLAFEYADIIIYIFDYQTLKSKSEEIMNDIQKILTIIKKESEVGKLLIFFHKTDLIDDKTRDAEINTINSLIKVPLYSTSIHPKSVYSLYYVFYQILSNFSEKTMILKKIIDKNIEDQNSLMCYITNQKNTIIVQTMTNDFKTTLINQFHQLIAHLTLSWEKIPENEIDYLSISSPNNLRIVMSKFGISTLKNLVIISENLTELSLLVLMGNIKLDISKYFEKIG
jgi:GTPase SAR1 family protein